MEWDKGLPQTLVAGGKLDESSGRQLGNSIKSL